ncbi:hypothetical protein Tco_0100375, partial [Tanacetum coccineum]
MPPRRSSAIVRVTAAAAGAAAASAAPIAVAALKQLIEARVSATLVVSLNLLSRTRKLGHSTMELRSLIS